jgi:hypothetical protein
VVETKLDKHLPRHSGNWAGPSGRSAGASVPAENVCQRRLTRSRSNPKDSSSRTPQYKSRKLDLGMHVGIHAKLLDK